MSADELKAKGNAAMAQNNFVDAVKYYSDAIALDPNNYVLYSNRSAAQVSLGNFEDALQDGEKTVSLNPGWGKVLQHHNYFSLFSSNFFSFLFQGYSRKGLALFKLNRVGEAVETYKDGLKVEPNNAALKEALSEIEGQADAGLSMFSQIFKDPNIWTMLQSDPELKGYLQQPDFLQMITEIQQNPKSIGSHLQDKRLMAVISKILLREVSDTNIH